MIGRTLIRGLEVGADDFLRKPVHGAELRARVSNLLKVRAYHRLLASQRDHALATVEQLRQQVLRADRLAMLGTFAAGVSHELNNIAHVLRSALELSRPGATPPPVGEELDPRELLAHVANHVTELSRTLLRIARPISPLTGIINDRQSKAHRRAQPRAAARTDRADPQEPA